jgi:hypothetical protein
LGAGANKIVAVDSGDPVTHDDGTSFIQEAGATNDQQTYTLTGKPAGISVVNGLTIGARHQGVGGQIAGFMRMDATNGTAAFTVNTGASWATRDPVAAPRPGGGSWTPADVFNSTLQMGVRCTVLSANCSTLWVELDYLPSVGALVFLLNLAGLGALPFVGAMDFAHFLRYLSWRRAHHPRHTILTGDEVRQAWNEIKAYRHPRFFLPTI